MSNRENKSGRFKKAQEIMDEDKDKKELSLLDGENKDIILKLNKQIDEKKMENMIKDYDMNIQSFKQFKNLIGSDIREYKIGDFVFTIQMNFRNKDYMEYIFFEGTEKEIFIKKVELVWKHIISPKMPFDFFAYELNPAHVGHIVNTVISDFLNLSAQKVSQS